NQSTDERPETFPYVSVHPLAKRTNFADFEPVDSQFSAVRTEKQLEPIARTRDTTDTTTHNPGDWLSKLDLTSAELSVNQENQLRQLLHQYSDIFSSKPGRTNVVKHHIDVGDSRPIKQGPYRLLNPERKAECTKQTAEMLNNDVAEPSFGPWASPVTLVPKKDGTLRFCIDFRKLNEVTVKDTYPIPRIDDTLDALKGAKYFSTLDLSSGFWQVELDEGSKEKTAFVTHEGIFQFNVMPFGLTNAPATFQRLMDLVLRGLKWSCCMVYLDDVIIYSPTFEQHLKDIDDVLKRIKTSGLTLKPSKCFFCHQELKYLGHIVSAQGIRPDPEKLEAVRSFPIPSKTKDVRAFLGLTGYYRRFIKNYAEVAEPLFDSIREKHNPIFVFTPERQLAFELLKERLIAAPIVTYPNFDYPFMLQLDACDYGLGAVLAQNIEHREHVIAYASRTLQPCERKYSAPERECLAIVWGTQHFRPYLEGRPFEVWTDHRSLQWLRSIKDPTSRLARWAMKLDAYDMVIKHRPGKANSNTDTLSRYPLKSEVVAVLQTNGIFIGPLEESQEIAVNLWDHCNILDGIKLAQRQDKNYSPLISFIQDDIQPDDEVLHRKLQNLAKTHRVIDGKLYRVRKFEEDSPLKNNLSPHLLVVPKSKRLEILKLAHDHPVSGHLGRRKTLHRISIRFFWEGMSRDVAQY
ncbi:unnamed protein product, partial [Didymodactylos carnosus]